MGERCRFFELLETRRLFAGALSEQIIVDQFGWRADAPRKVALFADPVNGQNAAVSYTPSASFQVRRLSDDALVFTGSTVAWKSGATDTVSGDKVWTGDFSSVNAPGEYYIYDPTNDLRSYTFKLGANLFNDILKTSTRVFYYQRTGTAIPAQFGGNWTHAIDHVGPNQDTQARQWQGTGPVAGSVVRDLSGGWNDAGDYNKYTPWTTSVLWNLMTAYEWNPGAFSDSTNIPESGNGVPDVLDEVKWELDWLRKMQLSNGSVINRMGNATFNAGNFDPSTDTQARYYTAPTTWATASFAASMAHAARLFAAFEPVYPGYSTMLLNAATNAWNYLAATPNMTPANGGDGTGGINDGGITSGPAGASAASDLRLRILAAAELFRATGGANYQSYFESNYNSAAAADNGHQPVLSNPPRMDATVATDLNRALVTYALSPGASAAIVNTIKNAVRGVDLSWFVVGNYDAQNDPYRSFMWDGHYTWGSNSIKSEWANLLLYALKLNVTPANNAKYLEIAEEYLHYIHGRNPLSQMYLSNMGTKGANLGGDKSVMQMYHSWFGDGSALYDGASSTYGPVPGYLAGGANQYFSVSTVTPPYGQPPMKAFRDWNTGWPENSWEITEPAIYYQASYSLLLSAFATDTFAPQVLASSFDHLTAPHAVKVQFNENVDASLVSADLELKNLTTNQAIPSAQLSKSFDSATNTATFTFAGGILPDGDYRLTVIGSNVTDASGNALAADATFGFFVLAGDADHDRDVDVNDLGILATNWQQSPRTFAQGDFDYTGTVDVNDLGILATHWQQQLADPSPSSPVTARKPAKFKRLAADVL
jgi:hypothetical protein